MTQANPSLALHMSCGTTGRSLADLADNTYRNWTSLPQRVLTGSIEREQKSRVGLLRWNLFRMFAA